MNASKWCCGVEAVEEENLDLEQNLDEVEQYRRILFFK